MKAQIGIETIFAYLLFAIAVIAALIIILFPGGIMKSRAEQKIEGLSIAEKNTAELELSAYLRAKLPDNLPDEIMALKSKNLDSGINIDSAADFLSKNPDIYKNRNYADFISSIYYLDKDERQNLFAAATRAAFSGKINDRIYGFPKIQVFYEKQSAAYQQPELDSSALAGFSGKYAEQPIPVIGNKVAIVTLSLEAK